MTTPDAVLQQYMELCSNDANRLGHQLASNAVLEWNGVTIRFAAKIVKFLRQKLHTSYQSFTDASMADAFESRQTHTSTKTIPPENLSVSASTSRTASEAQELASHSTSSTKPSSTRDEPGFQTPPKTLPAAPHPPALTAGRQFLPLSSDDDDDDDNDDEDDHGCTPAKRIKLSPSPTDHPRKNMYSELRYLEATGIVRTVNETKHRGTRTAHHIPRGTPPTDTLATTPPTPLSRNPVEKRTRLKLSYRTHLHTHDVQFALIIYEDLSQRTATVRRNLFAEETTVHEPRAESSPPLLRNEDSTAEPTPLPESPPDEAHHEELATLIPQPPATPFKRRRIMGMRTTPRRGRLVDAFGVGTSVSPTSTSAIAGSGSSGSSSSGIATNVQQTWPRKNQPTAGSHAGGSASGNNRKLSHVPTTIRKPLRF